MRLPVAAWILAAGMTALASPAPGQSIPKGAHSVVKGTSEICGVRAASAAGFEAKVRSSKMLREEPAGKRFRRFVSADRRTQWTFATRANSVYPLATCRQIIQRRDGKTMVHREMRCDAPRAACDRAFLEFHSSDEQLRRASRGNERSRPSQ